MDDGSGVRCLLKVCFEDDKALLVARLTSTSASVRLPAMKAAHAIGAGGSSAMAERGLLADACPTLLPLVRRTGRGMEAAIGDLRLLLARAGGRLEWLDARSRSLASAELFATLLTPAGEVRIRQEHDSAPRWVVCEQGPVRLVLRSQCDLLSETGVRWGEGLTEWTAYADGTVCGVAALRLVNADGTARLERAGLRFTGVGRPSARLVAAPAGLAREPFSDGGLRDERTRGFAFAAARALQCVAWRPGRAATYVGGRGPWQDFGDDVPYYEDWGTLPDQGWGDSGWQAGGAVECSEKAGGTLELEFDHGGRDVALPAIQPLQGQVICLPRADGAELDSLDGWLSPRPPTVAGGAWRGYSVNDAAHMVYAPEASDLTLTLGPSGLATAVHVYGLSHWGGWRVSCNGSPLIPQLVNDGRGCDDPNGLQLGRFDDRHGPIVGRTDRPANRMIISVPSSAGARSVRLRAVEGLALAYLHWDDRQTYIVQSSANQSRNLCEVTVRDGKLRHIAAPHAADAAVAAVPLYWYQCNTPTPYLATDEVVRYVLKEAGPEALELEVHSRNRYGCADGVYRARIPFDRRCTLVETRAELAVRKRWAFKDLQMLNLFTEEFRDYRLWPHEFALALDAAGRRLLKRPREGRRPVEGETFSGYTPPLLFAQYTAARGNVFLLQSATAGPVVCQHFLCPHWTDSHYHVVSPTGELQPGDRVAGAYTLLIDDGRPLTTADVETIAQAVLAGTPLRAAVAAHAARSGRETPKS